MTKKPMFINGMRVSLPRDGAPKWIKFNISCKVAELTKFLTTNQNEQGWLNIDVKESKTGNIYAELNSWQKGAVKPKSSDYEASTAETETPNVDVTEEELPF